MRTSHWFLLAAAGSGVWAAGCAADDPVPAEMVLTQGHEDGVWTRKPRPVRALVERIETENTSEHSRPDVPVKSFTLDFGSPARFRVTAFDADDSAVVRGQSVFIAPATFSETKIPLFVGRAGQFARPPGELALPQGSAPLVGSVWGQYVLTFGAQNDDGYVAMDGYDVFMWGPAAPSFPLECPKPPCVPESLALVGDGYGLLLGNKFATLFDLYTGASDTPEPPSGLETFDSVAGGTTAYTPNGSGFIVGATRAEGPSDAVLIMSPVGDGYDFEAISHHHQREGAAATWLPGYGLVIAGGNAEDPGVELLDEDGEAFKTLPYPADPTVGATLVPFAEDSVLRLGGELDGAPAPTVEIALDCEEDCALKAYAEPIALSRPQAFLIADGAILVVGDDAEGWTTAVRIDEDGTVSEVELREARRGGTAVRSPTGHVMVVGGIDGSEDSVGTVELYID